MLEDIKTLKKTFAHTEVFVKKLMDTNKFRTPDHAFVLLKATMKTLRDRIGPGEALHLGGQLPALLRGYYFEGYDLRNLQGPILKSKTSQAFFGQVRDYLGAYDFMDLEILVPIAMNIILDGIDQGESEQIVHQLPKDLQNLRIH
jgi:uncharacterized protein (DUF2267 family)